jgi:hypothetical protein
MGNMSGSSNMNTALKLSLYFLKALAWANRGPTLLGSLAKSRMSRHCECQSS